jgi:DNA (cytosine-5)-methyltransferase 1
MGGDEMDFVDIFCGIGTIRMGMECAGHRCVYSIELDKFKRAMHKVIFGQEPEGGDINNVRANDIPDSGCWCFGFPCTDVSIAGKQKGLSGNRSGLFYRVCEKLKEKENKPEKLFIENVKNLLSINGGWDFYRILSELDEIGYDAEWNVIDSAQVVPQHRERVYIIGHLRGKPWTRVFPIREDGQISPKSCGKERQIANCLRAKQGGSDIEEVYISESGRIRGLTWKECWRLQSIPEEVIKRIASNEFSKTRLRMAAGDSCTVNVIYEIAKKLDVFKAVQHEL